MIKLLKLREVAELSGLPLATLRYWARLRRIPVIQQGNGKYMMRADDLAPWLDSIYHPAIESNDHAKQEAKSD